jgi:hypothetical protein
MHSGKPASEARRTRRYRPIDLPVGLFCKRRVQPFFQKFFLFSFHANQFPNPRRPTPLEGRIAIVTNAGLDAMDAAALLTNSANADGEVVWS